MHYYSLNFKKQIMKAPLFLVFFSLYILGTVNAQNVIISELDANTEGTDVLEFIELKTPAPNQSLDGYIVVFLMVMVEMLVIIPLI